MPLAADEVLLYPRRRRYIVDICIGLVNNHRSGYRKKRIGISVDAPLIVFPSSSARGRQKAKPLLHIAILTAQVDATGGTDKSVPYERLRPQRRADS